MCGQCSSIEHDALKIPLWSFQEHDHEFPFRIIYTIFFAIILRFCPCFSLLWITNICRFKLFVFSVTQHYEPFKLWGGGGLKDPRLFNCLIFKKWFIWWTWNFMTFWFYSFKTFINLLFFYESHNGSCWNLLCKIWMKIYIIIIWGKNWVLDMRTVYKKWWYWQNNYFVIT